MDQRIHENIHSTFYSQIVKCFGRRRRGKLLKFLLKFLPLKKKTKEGGELMKTLHFLVNHYIFLWQTCIFESLTLSRHLIYIFPVSIVFVNYVCIYLSCKNYVVSFIVACKFHLTYIS